MFWLGLFHCLQKSSYIILGTLHRRHCKVCDDKLQMSANESKPSIAPSDNTLIWRLTIKSISALTILLVSTYFNIHWYTGSAFFGPFQGGPLKCTCLIHLSVSGTNYEGKKSKIYSCEGFNLFMGQSHWLAPRLRCQRFV